MDTREINKAIATHGVWKVRLHDAIVNRSSDFKPEIVSLDNECEFGKWFYAMPPADRPAEFWGKVQKLHARFHKIAGRVLELALSGKPEEALSMTNDLKGEFVTTSIELTNTLAEWKRVSSS